MSCLGHTVAVVIPAYRASSTLRDVVGQIPSCVDWIIVVDDASPDGLDGIIARIADSRVIYLQHEINQGVGGAMVTGYRKALDLRADFVCKIDSDGQMDPQHIEAFVWMAVEHNCDYVKANRFRHIGALRSMPPKRLFGNIAMSVLTKLAAGCWNIFDPQNGYVMIRRSMLRRLNLDRIDRSYFFENSMLINLNILGARIGELYLPARYGDELSSLRIRRVLFTFPGRLLRGLFHRVFQKYVFRSVSPIFLLLMAGLPATLFGMAWGAFAWYLSVSSGIPATTGTVVISLLPLIVGAMCMLQAFVLDVQSAGESILVDITEFEEQESDDEMSSMPSFRVVRTPPMSHASI